MPLPAQVAVFPTTTPPGTDTGLAYGVVVGSGATCAGRHSPADERRSHQ